METRRSADPVRVTDPDQPEDHQGWGVEGYAGGETVPSAETPGWGGEGHVERAPARPDRDPETGAGPDDDPGPGTHPASVLAGR